MMIFNSPLEQFGFSYISKVTSFDSVSIDLLSHETLILIIGTGFLFFSILVVMVFLRCVPHTDLMKIIVIWWAGTGNGPRPNYFKVKVLCLMVVLRVFYFSALGTFFQVMFDFQVQHLTVISILALAILELTFPLFVGIGLVSALEYLFSIILPVNEGFSLLMVEDISTVGAQSSSIIDPGVLAMRSATKSFPSITSGLNSNSPSSVGRPFVQIRRPLSTQTVLDRRGVIRKGRFPDSIALKTFLTLEEGPTEAVKAMVTEEDLDKSTLFEDIVWTKHAILAANKCAYLLHPSNNNFLDLALNDCGWRNSLVSEFSKFNPKFSDVLYFERMLKEVGWVSQSHLSDSSTAWVVTNHLASIAKEYSGSKDKGPYKFFQRLDSRINIAFVQARTAGLLNRSGYVSGLVQSVDSRFMADLVNFRVHTEYWFKFGTFRNAPSYNPDSQLWNWSLIIDPAFKKFFNEAGVGDGRAHLTNGLSILAEFKNKWDLANPESENMMPLNGSEKARQANWLDEWFHRLFLHPKLTPDQLRSIGEEFARICAKHNVTSYCIVGSDLNALISDSGNKTFEFSSGWTIVSENEESVILEISQLELLEKQLAEPIKYGFDEAGTGELKRLRANLAYFIEGTQKVLGPRGIQFSHIVVVGKSHGVLPKELR